MYKPEELVVAGISLADQEALGVTKALLIRKEVIRLKHEVKDALKAGVQAIDVGRLNERLQHIAKIPRPGLPKRRCNGHCRCAKGIVGVKIFDFSLDTGPAPLLEWSTATGEPPFPAKSDQPRRAGPTAPSPRQRVLPGSGLSRGRRRTWERENPSTT